MRRCSICAWSLLLVGVATYPAIAQDGRSATGVSLGRPQAMGADPAPSVRQTAFTPVGMPAFRGQAGESIQRVQPVPSPVWGTGFASESAHAQPGKGPEDAKAAPPDLPPPTPLPAPTPLPGGDVILDGCGMDCCGPDCCVMDCCGSGHPLRWLLPWNWCEAVYCCPWQDCYASAEYLLWWSRGSNSPPLVSTGVIGTPGATVLFGGPGALTQEVYSGGRFTVGWWLDCEKNCAIETTWFFLGQRSVTFNADSSVFPTLVRPFFSLNTNSEAGQIIAAPGGPGGGVSIESPSHLWGGEINFLHYKCCDCPGRWSLLAGFRYLQLQEQLTINSSSNDAGTLTLTQDNFGGLNRFAGGQVGLGWSCRGCKWSLDMRAKVALGGTCRSVNINGATVVLAPGGAATTANAGLLALSSNSGRFKETAFGVVPEFGINIGYQLTDCLRLYAGYTFLYWANVFRPGDQIDRVIDQTLIPGTVGIAPAGQNRPRPLLRDTGYWAQGLNFGLEYRY